MSISSLHHSFDVSWIVMNYNVRYSVNPRTGDRFYDESTSKMDNVTRKVLSKSIHKLESGNFGNCLPLKNRFGTCNSMYEMKIDYRDGYRIYFKKNDINKEIVVASAGIKKNQYGDVIKARGQLNEGFIIPD